MAESLKGWVHGHTITLDSPAPFEGRLVRVVLEPAEDEDLRLAPELQGVLWKEWAERGPQGPIEDEGEPEFP